MISPGSSCGSPSMFKFMMGWRFGCFRRGHHRHSTTMVEAPLFKEAMEKGQASLGVIASTFIYETVIRHDLGLTRYSQVQVDDKESSLLGGSSSSVRCHRRRVDQVAELGVAPSPIISG